MRKKAENVLLHPESKIPLLNTQNMESKRLTSTEVETIQNCHEPFKFKLLI